MKRKTHERRLCKGKSSQTGKPCKLFPIKGGAVCHKHGGRAPQVKNKAKERIKAYVADMVDPDRLLQEAARLALSDIREIYAEDGKLKPMKDWPDAAAATVAGAELVKRNVDSGDNHTDDVIKVKVWDKPKNIELLFKHLGMLTEKVKVDAEVRYKWEGE